MLEYILTRVPDAEAKVSRVRVKITLAIISTGLVESLRRTELVKIFCYLKLRKD